MFTYKHMVEWLSCRQFLNMVFTTYYAHIPWPLLILPTLCLVQLIVLLYSSFLFSWRNASLTLCLNNQTLTPSKYYYNCRNSNSNISLQDEPYLDLGSLSIKSFDNNVKIKTEENNPENQNESAPQPEQGPVLGRRELNLQTENISRPDDYTHSSLQYIDASGEVSPHQVEYNASSVSEEDLTNLSSSSEIVTIPSSDANENSIPVIQSSIRPESFSTNILSTAETLISTSGGISSSLRSSSSPWTPAVTSISTSGGNSSSPRTPGTSFKVSSSSKKLPHSPSSVFPAQTRYYYYYY